MARLAENDVYLPGFQLPDNTSKLRSDLAIALDGAEVVLSVMPSHLVRESVPADAARA